MDEPEKLFFVRQERVNDDSIRKLGFSPHGRPNWVSIGGLWGAYPADPPRSKSLRIRADLSPPILTGFWPIYAIFKRKLLFLL